MVLSAEKRNAQIIKELELFNGVLGDVQGDLERAAESIFLKYPSHAKVLTNDSGRVRAAIEVFRRIIVVLEGEDRELERERKVLLNDAERYAKDGMLRLEELKRLGALAES